MTTGGQASATGPPVAPAPDDIIAPIADLLADRLRITDLDVDTSLVDYGLDSVRAAELVVDVEEMFGIDVEDDDVADLRTTRDVAEYVSARVAGG